jgi:hypothetical protein
MGALTMSTEQDIKGWDLIMWWVSIVVCVLSLVLLIFSQACIWIGRMFYTWSVPIDLHTWVSSIVVGLFFLYAPLSLWRVWWKVRSDKKITDKFWPELCAYAIFWLFAPPLWFFLDYFSVASAFVRDLPDGYLNTTKDSADFGSKIWAAVLAALYFLGKEQGS